jgi:hypothetical protein
MPFRFIDQPLYFNWTNSHLGEPLFHVKRHYLLEEHSMNMTATISAVISPEMMRAIERQQKQSQKQERERREQHPLEGQGPILNERGDRFDGHVHPMDTPLNPPLIPYSGTHKFSTLRPKIVDHLGQFVMEVSPDDYVSSDICRQCGGGQHSQIVHPDAVPDGTGGWTVGLLCSACCGTGKAPIPFSEFE